MKRFLLSLVLLGSILCHTVAHPNEKIILGDEQTSEYFPILKGKRIAVFSNHTGMIGNKHLVDVSSRPNMDFEAMPMLESMYQVL